MYEMCFAVKLTLAVVCLCFWGSDINQFESLVSLFWSRRKNKSSVRLSGRFVMEVCQGYVLLSCVKLRLWL